MTDERPLTDEELAALAYRLGRALAGTGNRAAMEDGHRLVDEVRRLRTVEHQARLALIAELGEIVEDEGLEDLHLADLVRRLAKEITR